MMDSVFKHPALVMETSDNVSWVRDDSKDGQPLVAIIRPDSVNDNFELLMPISKATEGHMVWREVARQGGYNDLSKEEADSKNVANGTLVKNLSYAQAVELVVKRFDNVVEIK